MNSQTDEYNFFVIGRCCAFLEESISTEFEHRMRGVFVNENRVESPKRCYIHCIIGIHIGFR